ncbi:kinesin light chain 3 [Curvularia clavata]|uniref:Kinesin light chain 3 n=1 Tax=Curvularia clavata TaxID=95742 RepID=A0A9Q9DR43_CURCL|nr:kinesin light chain 3 [Curvularia clavata]
MRLLHFDHLNRLILTDFHGKPVPPYAILSHRWQKSEILFEDIASGEYKEKKDGYHKLLFCAKQAAQDQLQYFWIDTCCIDRWNSRERSRAINSMFRWYSNATKCYVFLSDVSVLAATDTPKRSDWEASFRASEWFTRGWTLQELIAPASVEFFSYEEHRLGDKSDLEQVVHEVTRIPLAALRNLPLDQFTRHERMHWADNRKTTEEEDIVYCLLGLVNVTMQANYSEGKDRARRRLQMEVEMADSIPSIIPFSRNDQFVGRESQIATLEAKLFADKHTTTMLAIVGPGGTGKSQLALELAYRTRWKNKSCSVFWVDASNKDSFDQSYTSIAQRLDIPGWDDEKTDTKQLVKLRLEQESEAHCLLILDNTEDISLGSSGLSAVRGADLTTYLPQSKRCSAVFTTTNSSLAKQVAFNTLIELHELTPDAARIMLENYLNTPVSSSEQQEAYLLLEELSRLPLAIVQATAYINATATTLQGYRSQLNTRNEHDVKQGSRKVGDRQQGWSAKSPVAATLFISLDEIRRMHALAADFLLLTACMAYKDIPLDLFDANSHSEREQAVQVLSRYALVTRRPEDSALDVHRLVHYGIREWLQQQDRMSQQTQHAFTQLLRVFPDHNHQNRSKWRRLLPHTNDGRYNEAEELFVQAMETRKRVLGKEHLSTLISMANLASTYEKQGRWKEAEELEVQVMEISLRWKQGRWKEAEELLVQVTEMSLRVLGEEHPNTLTSIANLASTYRKQGRWKEAEELEVQVTEMSLRVLGEEHPSTLTSIANLASTYRKQGRWKEAEELEVQVIETRKRVLGEEHPSTLTSMNNLAFTLKIQGRDEEALSLLETCWQLCHTVLGASHFYTKWSFASLNKWRANDNPLPNPHPPLPLLFNFLSRSIQHQHRGALIHTSNAILLALTILTFAQCHGRDAGFGEGDFRLPVVDARLV